MKEYKKVGEVSCNAGMAYFAFEPNCKELNAAVKECIRYQTQTAGVTFEQMYGLSPEETDFIDKNVRVIE